MSGYGMSASGDAEGNDHLGCAVSGLTRLGYPMRSTENKEIDGRHGYQVR
jgi:hypothetical protein